MEIVALFLAAFLQLATLSLDQLRDTIEAIAVEIAQEYGDLAK